MPRLQSIPVGDGRVVLRRGVTQVAVAGDDVAPVTEAVVDGLQSGRGVRELLASLPEHQQPLALDVLHALATRGILAEGAPADALDANQAGFYAQFGAAGQAAPAALARARVVLDGAGLIADGIRDGLAQLGVREVTSLEGPLDGCTVLVATSDDGDEEALLATGRRALAAAVPFLPVWLSDLTGFAGPLTWPYET